MEEIYKEIPDCPGYWASNLGNIKSTKRGDKLLKTGKSKLGYITLMLYVDRKLRTSYVSRLVLSAFKGYPAEPNLCYANHIDGDINNCNLDNLEWIICQTTSDYDPEKSKRRGIIKPDIVKQRMTQAKLNQSEETLKKAAKTRHERCLLRKV